MKIGIHDIAAATGSLYFDLAELAERTGVDVGKYYRGIGQEHMSLPTKDEDIVTMAARAAAPILDRHGTDGIRTVLFATESGVDQSKSAGIFLHSLLNLPQHSRIVELKEACYSGTAALQFAIGLVTRNPRERVLVIASDSARYELDTSGEPTQGSGAIAMLIAADPQIMEIEPASGLWSSDVMDFWRPNDRSTALVDGHYSVLVYLQALEESWKDYQRNGGARFQDISRFCYHQPFTKMAVKAHRKLADVAGASGAEARTGDLEETMIYNRRLGNSYTASVFFAFLSLIDNAPDLTDERVALFSYGSGAVAEFITGIMVPGYERHLRKEWHTRQLDERQRIGYDEYRERHLAFDEPGDKENPVETLGEFRFSGIKEDKREYEVRS